MCSLLRAPATRDKNMHARFVQLRCNVLPIHSHPPPLALRRFFSFCSNSCVMFLPLVLLSGLLLQVSATLTLPTSIASHMVLQRNDSVIWGLSSYAQSPIVVNNRSVVFSDNMGAWKIRLSDPAHQAAWEFTNSTSIITISDQDSIIGLTDVLFGDVLLCVGQSNMAMSMAVVFNSSAEIADSINYPLLRMYTQNATTWLVSGPQAFDVNAADLFNTYFSAACYFAGREMQRRLGIPIGLVAAVRSKTAIEPWSSPEAIARCPNVEVQQAYLRSYLWENLLVPLLEMRFRAILFYQGEGNVGDPGGYGCRLPAAIQDWRDKMQSPSLPFVFVQLASIPAIDLLTEEGVEKWSELQLVQDHVSMTVSNTAMVSAIDLGDPECPYGAIHPRYKQEVGMRLAHALLKLSYSVPIVAQGPRLLTAQSSRSEIELQFNTTSALRFQGTLNCDQCCNEPPFEVRTLDGWTRVNARIAGSSVFLQSTHASQVRYAFEPFVQCVIYNEEGWPLTPFVVAPQEPPSNDMYAVFLFLPVVAMILVLHTVSIPPSDKPLPSSQPQPLVNQPATVATFGVFLFEYCAFTLHTAYSFLLNTNFRGLACIALVSYALYYSRHSMQRLRTIWVSIFTLFWVSLIILDSDIYRSIILVSQGILYLSLLVLQLGYEFTSHQHQQQRRVRAAKVLRLLLGLCVLCCLVYLGFSYPSSYRAVFEGAAFALGIMLVSPACAIKFQPNYQLTRDDVPPESEAPNGARVGSASHSSSVANLSDETAEQR